MNIKLCVLFAVLCFTASVSCRYNSDSSEESEDSEVSEDSEESEESSEEIFVPKPAAAKSISELFGTRKIVQAGRPTARLTVPLPPPARGVPFRVQAGRPVFGAPVTHPTGPAEPVDPVFPPAPRSRFGYVKQ